MAKNGEELLIRKTAAYFSKKQLVAFDVGAHKGDWARAVKCNTASAQVHCFDISERMTNTLSKSLHGYSEIQINTAGLSDKNGEAEFRTDPTAENLNSIHASLPWPGNVFQTSKCTLIRGSDYMRDNGIEWLHLLKIDTEGHDLFVLKGFLEHLRDGRISVIQFEYGVVCIASRTFLADFYDLLQPLGYKIGRLYPSGVEFKPYDPFRDEHFRMGNYVAVFAGAASHLVRSLSNRGNARWPKRIVRAAG